MARAVVAWRRRGLILGAAVQVCFVLGGCGSGTPSTPTASLPTPLASATPEATGGGFLHVLRGSSVVTYSIDRFAGTLQPSVTQDVGDAHTLAGEPRGRRVFAAFGPRGGPPYWDPSVVVYAPDPLSGALQTLSEASSDPIWCRGCSPWGRSGRWYRLTASSTHVYGMWSTGTYHDVYQTYVAHPIGDDGQLGSGYVREFGEWDPGLVTVAVDSDRDVFYKVTPYSDGLTAHFVEPDGSLRQMGASSLCFDAPLGASDPLVAVRGFLFASGGHHGEYAVCSWEGPRLAPRAPLELDSRAQDAAALPLPEGALRSLPGERPVALVAMMAPTLRLFAMRGSGDLTPLDSVQSESGRPLFHPSGRFLYASREPNAWSAPGSPGRLTVYSIGPDGHLTAVQTLEDGGGTMAVTTPVGGVPRL